MSGKTMPNECAVLNSGKSQHSPELRIVLIGGREIHGNASKKSACGNIILGESAFDTSRRTTRSVARQKEVHGRQVTVVDTPGWWLHYPRENTPELDKIEIENSVHLCHPGPNAFLLVIPAGVGFHQVFKSSLEEHLKLFPKGVLDRTIVLFTVKAKRGNKSLEEEISIWPALQWIINQCGNRKHVLNVNKTQKSAQVIKLFEKIDAMVEENSGSYFSVDRAAGEALSEKMQAIVKRASTRCDEVKTQRGKLKALIEGGKTPPTHLRMVMLGAQWSAKSSSGNTILRKLQFSVSHSRTTEYCEMSHSMVAGRQLTVIDSPGWLYNHTLQETCEMDKLEIESSMYLCPPGPHVVLLVVDLASAFNAMYQRAVQEHMTLFSDNVWEHTVVLFSRGDWLGEKTVEERIESEKGLQWLVEKCGNRYHVLNNMNQSDETQVTELLEKIEEMWAGKRDPHYEVDLGSAEHMEEKKQAGDRMAQRIRQMAQTQSRVLKELFRGETQSPTDMRLILVGKNDSGKSMAGNRMLFEEAFGTSWMKKEFEDRRGSKMSIQHQHQNVGGVDITIVEAPGWSANTGTSAWLKGEVLRTVSMCAPGPHAFLLVIPVSKAFTEEDRKAFVELLKPFSERVWRHCMVLFTWGDWLVDRSVEDYIAREGQAMQWLVEKCENRYHVLNCNCFVDAVPVIMLFQEIIDMITRNKGHYPATGDGMGTKEKLLLPWHAMLRKEDWNRREQELVDRMLKAIAQQPEEPALPSVRRKASMDGAFIPSLKGHDPSDVGSTFWSQTARAKVSEWLSRREWNSGSTSGIGLMNSPASNMEKIDWSPLIDDNHQSIKGFYPDTHRMRLDSVAHSRVSTDIVGNERRHSF